MKTKIIIALVVVIAVIGGIYTCRSATYINQGEVGVVWTAKDGVRNEVLTPGLHFVPPLAKVKAYPVSQQQLVLSNNPEDYNSTEHADWHVDAPADGGMVKMNLTVNYNFMQDKVVSLYTKFNGMDGNTIVENMVQNSIIAYIKEVTPQFTVMDIYSDRRAEVSSAITKYLNDKLNEEYGINVSSALIIDVQLDETLLSKVQAKEQAKQDAEKAELDKQTAVAQGEAAKARVQAEADVKKIQTDADVDRYKRLGESITPQLVQKWEMDARLKHGWVEIQGANTVVTEQK